MVLKRKLPSEYNEAPLFRSERIEDRDSIFIGQYSPTEPVKLLQSHPDFKDASHRMIAWRKPSKQKALFGTGPAQFDTGFDDDGEKYAGKRIAKVLEEMGVVGAVVVARWYGGILLGAVRFTHIEKCARDAIGQYNKSQEHQSRQDSAASAEKKRKLDEDARRRLLRDLPERDSNILALRSLLAQKRDTAPNSSTPASQSSPSKVIDYTQMPTETLKKLELARDRTISFLLKSIDEAEEKASKPRNIEPSPNEQGEPKDGGMRRVEQPESSIKEKSKPG